MTEKALLDSNNLANPVLTDEQQVFINTALSGKNVLVDACIGSGKTTSIQRLCDEFPSYKSILYLTYNRLLKIDARSKILNKNVVVTNYHGFAYNTLKSMGITVGIPDLIQKFNEIRPQVGPFDVLIIDEYQDIELELSEMLVILKDQNPNLQIIAVGDMEQKIYDKTTLDVSEFIKTYLNDYITLSFSKCFRLPSEYATKLGRIWNKTICGVNNNCVVETMTVNGVIDYLSNQKPGDLLCLGSRTSSAMTEVLNTLESDYNETFNKNTVYASISDDDSFNKIEPKSDTAIFTTFDSSKGLEKKICVVFDFYESYWEIRANQPNSSYEILRNIFCVAASRGKKHIIFVTTDEAVLSEETLSTPFLGNKKYNDVFISDMFDFKYKEDVETCYSFLDIEKKPFDDSSEIYVKGNDGLIDLSPCIGIYQEASYFEKYNIENEIIMRLLFNHDLRSLYFNEIRDSSIENKVLFLTSLETKQERYRKQVSSHFVNDIQKEKIKHRLSEVFTVDENVQVRCSIDFSNAKNGERLFSAIGMADVIKDETVYELKFVSELKHEHFLQCACYMIALNLEKGILWNTRNNSAYAITIPDKSSFMNSVAKAITKGVLKEYNTSKRPSRFMPNPSKKTLSIPNSKKTHSPIKIEGKSEERIAVIDTETNFKDKVMSVGVVIADNKTFQIIDERYYIFNPEFMEGGMYSYALNLDGYKNQKLCSRNEGITDITDFLQNNHTTSIFAYNASFDKSHLPELSSFDWYDIMAIAANRKYNYAIPSNADCYGTGRLKRNYGVESIIKLLTNDSKYTEKHNALLDAKDELKIMESLSLPTEVYTGKQKKSYADPKKKTAVTSVSNNKPITDESTNNKSNCSFTEHNVIVSYEQESADSELDSNKTASESNLNECSTAEAASYLGVSRNTIYNMISRGDIEARKKGRSYAISIKSIEDYINKQRKRKRFFLIFGLVAAGVMIFMWVYFMYFFK